MNPHEIVNFILHTPDGEIFQTGSCGRNQLEYQETPGLVLLEGSAVVGKDFINDSGNVVTLPDKPSKYHKFDYKSKTWVDPRTLEEHKTAQWSLIKAARDEAEFGGFTWDGSVFDSDPVSQARIQGAVLLVTSNPDFVVDWTLADNTVRSLTTDGLNAISQALGEHVTLQHSRARDARALLDQATTLSEVQSISF